MNSKIYIHEYIDITLQNRANYMYHMTANYSPIAQEERGQLCYGVWGVVGSTGRWPQTINVWEEDGFDGMARSFAHETGNATMQDPKLAKWWAQAAQYRSGGFDRLLIPAPWMRTIAELTADGVTGHAHAHVQVKLKPDTATDYLATLETTASAVTERFGWQLAGAWRTAMVGDSECIVHWVIPTWQSWADFENAAAADRTLGRVGNVEVLDTHRFIMVDAPLSPFRTGRQPRREDRSDEYAEV